MLRFGSVFSLDGEGFARHTHTGVIHVWVLVDARHDGGLLALRH